MSSDRWAASFAASLWVVLVGLASCASPWVNLSKLGVSTWPDTPNQVLTPTDKIRVTFSAPVDHPSTQNLLNVTSADGVAMGDRVWQGDTLAWTPVATLTPGKRYTLEFSGQVRAADGRVFSQAIAVPFYSASDALPGVLRSFSPLDGASASVTVPLVLNFSAAMDPASFETGFSL